MIRRMITDEAYRAVLTLHVPERTATTGEVLSAYSREYIYGPYSKPGPAKAAITKMSSPYYWPVGAELTSVLERADVRWEPMT